MFLLDQQQVQEIRFENVIIQKLKNTVQKNGNLINWLHLLKAYHENGLFQYKDEAIHQMHHKFVLKEDFWLKEINRKLSSQDLNQNDIEFIYLAFDDGLYEEAANLVYKRLVEEAIKNKNGSQKCLRTNFIISKLQKLISLFHREVNYYPGIRKIYLELGKDIKVRETFIREIKEAYDDFDITFEQYRYWEPSQEILESNASLYETAKENWQSKATNCDLSMYSVLKYLQIGSSFDSFLYLKSLQALPTQFQKIWYLRRICLSRRELVCEYVEKLEYIHSEDQQIVLKAYKTVIEFSPEAQMAYLKFLVRRFNKHLNIKVEQSYYDDWGKKVAFFRQEIATMIKKKRLTPKTQQSIQQSYYNFWADVETALIKDKTSICQIFEQFLQVNPSVSVYTKYSKSLIKLGFFKDAKQVLKRSYQAFKYDFQALKQYELYLAIYGNINDLVEFRRIKNEEKLGDSKDSKEEIENNKLATAVAINQQAIVPLESRVNKVEKINGKPPKDQVEMEKDEKDHIEAQKRPRKEDEEHITEISAPKKRKFTDSGCTLFIKGIKNDWDQKKIRSLIKYQEAIKQIRFVHKNDKRQNYCYVEMNSEEVVDQQCKHNQNKNLIYIAKSKPTQSDTEQRTLFLCGLPETVTQQKIKEVFKDYGGNIASIRLKNDGGNTYAYVQFANKQLKVQILQQYQQKKNYIDKKLISIKQCNSHKAISKKQYRIVILKNLAFKTREEDLLQFFKDYQIEAISIPKNEQDKPRGFAFVKFKSKQDFERALHLKSGKLRGREFQIEKSQRDIKNMNTIAQKTQPIKQKQNDYFSNLFK